MSDANSITCTTGPRGAGRPLAARDELINHGHLLNSCSCTVINGSVDWGGQQRVPHLLKQQSCSAKGTAAPSQQRGDFVESGPKVTSPPWLREGLPAPLRSTWAQTPCHGVLLGSVGHHKAEGWPWWQLLLPSHGDTMEQLHAASWELAPRPFSTHSHPGLAAPRHPASPPASSICRGSWGEAQLSCSVVRALRADWGLTSRFLPQHAARAHTAAASTRPPAAAAVSGAQPASSLVPAAGFNSGPSECRRGERLKAVKPSVLSGKEGTTQTQSGPLPMLALRLVCLHAKAEPGSPFIKALIGTGVHQIIFQPLASAGCLHAVPCMLLH